MVMQLYSLIHSNTYVFVYGVIITILVPVVSLYTCPNSLVGIVNYMVIQKISFIFIWLCWI